MSRAGDVNKDGIEDIIIAAYMPSKIGLAYVIFGGKYDYKDYDLNTINLSTSGLGFKITGVSAAGGFAISVSRRWRF